MISFSAFPQNETKPLLRNPSIDNFGLAFDNHFGNLSRLADHSDALSDQSRTLIDHARNHDNQMRTTDNRVQNRCGLSKSAGEDPGQGETDQVPKDKPGGNIYSEWLHYNKTCHRGFRQSEFQTSLLSYRDQLENLNFARSKFRYDTFQ